MSELRAALVGLVLAQFLASPGGTLAAGPSVAIVADVAGAPIPIGQVPDYYCHDRDFPRIHCFRSAELLDQALAVSTTPSVPRTATEATGDYVRIYSLPGQAGSYMVLSQDYDALALIGWNDRIQSFIGLGGATGTFYTDWFAGGYKLTFCCNSHTWTLSATFNNAISSAYHT